MLIRRVLALGATVMVFVAACSSGSTPAPSASSAASASAAASGTVIIGSESFNESKIMAELYAQVLEKAGYTVERKFGLGSRQERAPAFEGGQINLAPEYVGSGLGYYDKTKVTSDGEKNRTGLQAVYDSKSNLATVFAISPGQDTNAATVRGDTATSMNLAKMSDLAAVQTQLKWGLPPDCDANPLCKGALVTYGITYPPAQRQSLAACSGPIAQALNGKAVDFAWLCSTQPAIKSFGFKVLEDDKGTQPAENIAPVVRNDLLDKIPDKAAFQALLDAVSAKVTTDVLIDFGQKLDVDQEDLADVAKDFLAANNL